ncbi:hypothetical protein HFO63_34190 [Rhizobium laguerreae]|nr:hypothetical protein [Rhizobium laguerreae]MBY3150543.1 hypothetical protein [Rhizobium laguerreae]
MVPASWVRKQSHFPALLLYLVNRGHLTRNDKRQFLVLALAFLMSMFFRSYFVFGPLVAGDSRSRRVRIRGLGVLRSFGLLQMRLGSAFDRFGAQTLMAVLMIGGAAGEDRRDDCQFCDGCLAGLQYRRCRWADLPTVFDRQPPSLGHG